MPQRVACVCSDTTFSQDLTVGDAERAYDVMDDHNDERHTMAIFYISVWQGEPNQGNPLWGANVLAQDIEDGYRIGKTRFSAENPDLDIEDYIVVASGDSVEKSIGV